MNIAKPSIKIEKRPVIIITQGQETLAITGQDFKTFALTDPKLNGNTFVAADARDANTGEPVDVIIQAEGLSFTKKQTRFEVPAATVSRIVEAAHLTSDIKMEEPRPLTLKQIQALSPQDRAAYEWESQTPGKVPVKAIEVIEID